MQPRAFVLAALVAGCGSRPAAPAVPPAEKGPSKAARWTSGLKRLDDARRAGDARTALRLLGELRDLAPNNPQLQLAFARVAAERGDTAEAARWLGHYAAAGMTLGPEGAKLLAALAGDPHIAQLTEQLAANGRAMGAADRVFDLPTGDKLFEDLVWAPSAGALYITSVRERRVYAFTPGLQALRPLTEPEPEGIGVLDVAFDPARNVLWMSTAPLPPVPGYRKGDDAARASSIAAIDPSTGRIVQRVELRPDGKPHALSDLAVTSAGDVVVSDATGGGLYILRAGRAALERLSADFDSPQTPAPRDATTVYVPDYSLGIARVDTGGGAVSWLSASPDIALSGIDGLYFIHDALVAVQNGTHPPRVVRLALAPDGRSITSATVLAASPELGEPTHGAFVDGQLFFLANSGWSRFSDDGSLVKDPPEDAPSLWRVPLTAR
ncbi:MAG TPA: tetratricopeptide repeat protein [Kofleriaceae bacterium]|nr:tetratricopeptide repeat protein [Kofleriaceae bacterium]